MRKPWHELTPAARSVYASCWRRFEAWCHEHGSPPLPARPEEVAHYLDALADRGLKPASLKVMLNAIAQAHRDIGHSDLTHHHLIREAFAKSRAAHGAAPPRAGAKDSPGGRLDQIYWRQFVAFSERRGHVPLPADPHDVAFFLQALANAGRKPSTIGVALNAISRTHRAADLPSPRGHPIVREQLRRINDAQPPWEDEALST